MVLLDENISIHAQGTAIAAFLLSDLYIPQAGSCVGKPF